MNSRQELRNKIAQLESNIRVCKQQQFEGSTYGEPSRVMDAERKLEKYYPMLDEAKKQLSELNADQFGNEIDIKVGDWVKIKCNGFSITMQVLSVYQSIDWSIREYEYSIEGKDENGRYRYWKQDSDGGTVEVITK